MSRSLGTLTLDLIAKTGGFEQGMDRASRRVRSTADEMEAARRAADRYIMAVGAAAVAFAGAAAAMAVQSAKAMDATSKMAQQIGTTTEALSGMRFAAQQFANISDQQFDMSMRRMTRRIAEAAEGSGAAKNALDAMGLSARELARLSPDKQMLAIADAMQKTERQADRLRHTMAIFDTEGMALVPALQQGAAAFEQNIELARRFGVVVSTEAAQAAEQFTTNMGLLSKAQEGFRNQLAEAVLPMLADFSGHLVEIAQRIGPMGDVIEKALKAAGVAAAATAAIFVSRLIGSITASAMAWTAATAEAARYQMALARMAASASGASASITAMTGAAAGGMAVMSRAGQLALGILGGSVGLVATIGLTAAGFLAMGRDARTASVDIDELSESFKTLSAQKLELRMFDLEDEVKRLEDQARQSGEILRTMESDALALADAQGVTADELENVRRSLLEQRDAHDANNAELDRARTLLNQVIDHLGRMQGAAHGAAGGVHALNEAMTNDAGRTYLERLSDNAITAGLKTQREQLEALVKAGKLLFSAEDLEKARRAAGHIDKMNASLRAGTKSASDHASAMKSLIERLLPGRKALEDLHKGLGLLSAAQKSGVITALEYDRALQVLNATYAKSYQEALPEHIRKLDEQLEKLREQDKTLTHAIQVFGLADSAVMRLAESETRAALARAESTRATEIANGADEERILILDEEIVRLRQIAEMQAKVADGQVQKERQEATKKANDEILAEWGRITEQVEQSLTDAIFGGAQSGKDLLQNLFKNMVLRVLVQPIVGGMMGSLGSSLGVPGVANAGQDGSVMGSLLGSGGQGAGIMGMINTARSVYSALSGGVANPLGQGIGWVGEQLGSSALQSFAGGLSSAYMSSSLAAAGNAAAAFAGGDAIGAMAAQYGAMTGSSAGVAGSMAGTALSYLGGAAAGYGLGTAISGNMAAFGNQNISTIGGTAAGALIGAQIGMIGGPLGAVIGGAIGGLINRAFGKGPREIVASGLQGRLDAGAGHTVVEAFDDWTRKGGWFSSGDSGTLRYYQEDTTQMLREGIENTFKAINQYANVFGMNTGNLSQYRREFKISGDDAGEQLERMLTDFINDVIRWEFGDHVGEFQRQGEDAGDALIRLADALMSVNPMLENLGHRLFEVSLAGADMASHLSDLFGGDEAMAAITSNWYDLYYTDAEKAARATEMLTREFASLGYALPDSRQQLREWVDELSEGLDDGRTRELYVSLMALGEAFAVVDEVNRELNRELEEGSRLLAEDRLRTEQERMRAIETAYGRYLDLYFSDAEKLANLTADVAEQFAALGLAMPDSQEQLREWIEEQERAGDSGRELRYSLLLLAESFAEIDAAAREEAQQRLELWRSVEAAYIDIVDPAGKFLRLQQQITDRFAELGHMLPADIEQYRRLVDLTGQMGDLHKDEHLALMQLAPDFLSYIDALDEQGRAARDARDAIEQSARAWREMQDATKGTIMSGASGLRERILLDQLGSDESRYAYFKSQADSLSGLINQTTDLKMLEDIFGRFISVSGSAYGLLDEDQRREMNSEFQAAINDAEARALQQAEKAQQVQTEAVADATYRAVDKHMKIIVDNFVLAMTKASGEFGAAGREMAYEVTRQMAAAGYGIKREASFAEIDGV